MPSSYKIMDAKLFTMEVCPEKTSTHLHNEMEQIRAAGSLPISSFFCMKFDLFLRTLCNVACKACN